jgi:radical SAM superfamily enzyme YgiQ (UPF0313 family)
MNRAVATVGLVQIGEVVWERRPSRQYRRLGHVLRPKEQGAGGTRASLAYLPHSVGLLQAFVQEHAPDPGAYAFLTPIYKRIPVEQAAGHLAAADVVGFSAYVWNVQLSLRIAEILKSRRPETLILFGGPQVPDDAEDFLRANPFIDLACHGEGEWTFLEVLELRDRRRWEGVRSISFIDRHGRFVRHPRRERIRDLDEVPSPLLSGVYGELMRSNPDQDWLLTWETNRGCPFSCTFCDWGSATASRVFRYSLDRLAREIEWMTDHDIHHLFVCDANFGLLPRDLEIARKLAEAYSRRGTYLAIHVQNTKNRVDRSEAIQSIFRDSGVISFGASISLQTVDPAVLKAIRRDNISSEAFESLQRHYAREGLDTYTDLILGLPEQTYDSFADGINQVIRDGQLNRVVIYECTMLPNAAMAESGYRTEHGLETVPVRIVHAHEPLGRARSDEVPETIDVVVATRAMGRDDWVRARTFAALVELLFFDRLLHVPMVLLGEGFGLGYRRMIEAFLDATPSAHPTVAATVHHFRSHSRDVQGGAPLYVPAPEWLDLWWPDDQYALISLAREGRLGAFYDEAQSLLTECAAGAGVGLDPVLLDDAVRLNRAMFALPRQWNDEVVELSYTVATAYHAALGGRTPIFSRCTETVLVERSGTVWLSWEDWCEDLVRNVYVRRKYLYPIQPQPGPALALAASRCMATAEGQRDRSP